MRKLQRAVALVLTLVMVLAVLPLGAAAHVGPGVTVPAGQELVYFADCGANSFTSDIATLIAQYSDSVLNQATPDQAYDASDATPWGYTNPTDELETNNADNGDIYKSIRNFKAGRNGKTLSYKFTVPAGTYQVVVGLHDPWSGPDAQSRVAEVQVNQSAMQEFRYANHNAGMLTFENVTLAEAGTIDVNVAPDDPNTHNDNRDALVSFIMVTRTMEEPEPEPTVPEAPNPKTPIWGPNGSGYALHVHYICDNEDAAHQGGNDVLDKKNFITAGEYFTFGAVTEHNGVYEVTATVNANKLLEDKFGVAHTVAGTTTLTLEYLEASKKWAIKSDSDVYELTLTGTCTVGGPEAPTNETCSTFYVTVYGIDGADTNRVLRSTAHTVSNGGFTISYGQVQKIDGVWTCEATIDATDKINSVLESQQANHYIMEDDAPTSKTVTLTYNQNSGKWVAENDGVTYSDDRTRAGVAFPLIKQYSVTYLPGDQLNGNPVPGDPIDGGLFAVDATVPLPQTTTFTNDGYIFAGWKTTVQEGSKKVTHYFPVGTTTMDMFAQDVELKAYWMKLTLEVASAPYRENLTVDNYTFDSTASFSTEEDSITVLYRADIWGNSTYPYALTCEGAQEVYGSSLSGTIPLSSTTTYVYFTKTYTPEDEISSETVSMAGASDSAAVSITWNTEPDAPEAPNSGNCTDFYVTVYGEEPRLDDTVVNHSLLSSRWSGYSNLVSVTFAEPTKNGDGSWICVATVDASKMVEDQLSKQDHYRKADDLSTTKTVILTYNEDKGEWVAPSDGVAYGYPSSLTYKNGVAFKLVKQFEVTFTPGLDLAFKAPTGDVPEGGYYDAGAQVNLPETTSLVATKGKYAGWMATVKNGTQSTTYYYPIGTDMEMFATDVTLKAYWMDVELDVASEAYDATKAVTAYTFGNTATFQDSKDSVTVLYRAKVLGNSRYPYALSCNGATAVYSSALSGSIDMYNTYKYVYFTKTYTSSDGEISSETVRMGNASDSAAVSITWKGSHEHTYAEPQWTWAADNSTATATFTCSDCDDEQIVNATVTSNTTEPTCTTDGKTVYSATVTFGGESYTDAKTVTLPATGHDYGDPQWTWNTDNNTATATFTCSSCDDVHTKTATATSVTTAPTCTADGKTVYSATVTFNHTEYTGTKTVTLPATGHDYGAPQWSWHKDFTAYAVFTCANDKTHQETCKASVTRSVQKATCTRPETSTYTATVVFNGTRYQDKLVVEGYALGHRWNDGEVTTRPTASKPGERTYTCLRCGAVKYETIPATGETVVDYFWDVSAHDWFADEVTYVVEAGLMEGVGNHLFDPNGEVTRAMTWTVLARMDGEDVDGGTPWYAKARTWAMDDGVSDGTNPNNAVTREQLVTMLYRYAGSPRVYGTLTGYTDCDKVSDWAVDAMIWATDTGLIQGMGGKLNPQGTATRAQLATMLMRFVEIMK